ncbi:MAG TPA: GNAT family N-acetyltransferase [Gaiella sp.]|nr:GNAT family N-acetyltransferase [Gaiella sp.]
MIVRRPTPERFAEALALLQASDAAVWGASDWTESDLREDWERLDLDRDGWLVELDGRLAGVAHLLDRKGARFIGDAYVHPELTGRGVGSLLLRLLEQRAYERRDECPEGEPVVLQAAHLVGDDHAPGLFGGCGFERVRSFFRMVVEVDREHPAPAWPENVEVRPFDVEEHGRAIHAAQEEAFAAEWGHVERPYEEWRERAFDLPNLDPSLVVAAWAGDEIVAFSLNYPKRNGDWGWIGMLGVRADWRRRGLGLALLRESFARFRAMGETTVALGVDTENPTGATRLYERAGMGVLWQADVWQKELDRDTSGPPPVSTTVAA